MDDKKKEKASENTEKGLCLESFCMTSVKAQETEESSEIPRRLGKAIALLVFVAVAVAAIIWWAREGKNLTYTPTESDKQFIVNLELSDLAEKRALTNFRMNGPDTVDFDIAPRFTLEGNSDNQAVLRKALNEMVASFSNERPNRSVKLEGFQDGKPVAEGSLNLENLAHGKPPVWVHIQGEEMGPGSSGTLE